MINVHGIERRRTEVTVKPGVLGSLWLHDRHVLYGVDGHGAAVSQYCYTKLLFVSHGHVMYD